MEYHDYSVNVPACTLLLYEELLAVDGVVEVGAVLLRTTPIRTDSGVVAILGIEGEMAPVLADVDAVVAAHVWQPAPGPVGMARVELEDAWRSIGYKAAAQDAVTDLLRLNALDFHATLEDALDSATPEQRDRKMGWAIYYASRVLVMPMPPDYDPFDEATVEVLPDGTLRWTPNGPPWG